MNIVGVSFGVDGHQHICVLYQKYTRRRSVTQSTEDQTVSTVLTSLSKEPLLQQPTSLFFWSAAIGDAQPPVVLFL